MSEDKPTEEKVPLIKSLADLPYLRPLSQPNPIEERVEKPVDPGHAVNDRNPTDTPSGGAPPSPAG